jgi:hypothetical protein
MFWEIFLHTTENTNREKIRRKSQPNEAVRQREERNQERKYAYISLEMKQGMGQ